jgi:hypothetical protein
LTTTAQEGEVLGATRFTEAHACVRGLCGGESLAEVTIVADPKLHRETDVFVAFESPIER